MVDASALHATHLRHSRSGRAKDRANSPYGLTLVQMVNPGYEHRGRSCSFVAPPVSVKGENLPLEPTGHRLLRSFGQNLGMVAMAGANAPSSSGNDLQFAAAERADRLLLERQLEALGALGVCFTNLPCLLLVHFSLPGFECGTMPHYR